MLVASSLFAVSNASNDDNSLFIIFGLVAGGIFLIFICIACYSAQLQQRKFRRYWSAGRFTATTVAYTGTSVPQLGPHYPHQRPPVFQQTCPCHPSPVPEQRQTFTPPSPHTLKQRKQYREDQGESMHLMSPVHHHQLCLWIDIRARSGGQGES